VEIMANEIRQNKHIEGLNIRGLNLSLLQYADDTNGMLKDLNSAKCFLHTVKDFGLYSGLMLNMDKTEAMWLGSDRVLKTRPLGILWPDRPLRILGVHLSYDQAACDMLNFHDKIVKAKRLINLWSCRNLTLYGRCQIIKTYIVSQFLFVSSIIQTPPEIIKAVNNVIFKFIWKNKRDRLKRSVLQHSIENGGLRVPDFGTMINAAMFKWIKKLISGAEPPWKLILRKYFEHRNIHMDVLLYSDFSLKSLDIPNGYLPKHYRKVLTLLCNYGNTMPIRKSNLIWYNKNICIHGKSLFYQDFHEAGAWYVKDLYQDDNTPVPFKTWVDRGVKAQQLIKWMGLIRITRKMLDNTDIVTTEVTQLSIAKRGPIAPLKSNVIYEELLGQKVGFDVCKPRVSKYVQNSDSICWKNIFKLANRTPLDTKTKEFQYRCLHDLLANKYWLHKWGIKQSASCTYCNNGI
jgi:hypothetical protein